MDFFDFQPPDFTQLGGAATSTVAKAQAEATGKPAEFLTELTGLLGESVIKFGRAGIDLGVEKIGQLFDNGSDDDARRQFTGVQPDASTSSAFLGGVSGKTVAIIAGVGAALATLVVVLLRVVR